MKVKELIEKLSGLDPDTPVVIPGIGDDYAEVRNVRAASLWTEGDGFYERIRGSLKQGRTVAFILTEIRSGSEES